MATTEVALRVGQVLVVEFDPGPWTAPTSSEPGVVSLLATTTTDSGTVGSARFAARGVGVAQVHAVTHFACEPQCLPPDRVYDLTVTVR